MEKTIVQIKTHKELIHQFWCDCCNKYLGQSEEYEDGYYDVPHQFSRKYYDPSIHQWYELNLALYDECAKEKDKEIIANLEKLGFTSLI